MRTRDVLTEEDARRHRTQLPIFDHTVYLNSCSLGPPSRRVIGALEEYANDWSTFGAPAWWERWLPTIEAARERFAQLIGAGTHEVTVSHSISSALSSIASTVDYQARPAVVCADIDFPTIPYQWLAKRSEGLSVRFARSPDRIALPVDAFRAHVDTDVALIATSHVFYASGAVQPVRDLADLAHRRGALIVIDGYHAVGALPVDVKALDVDFYVGGTLKWLLGGPGLTFIYVREDLISKLHPRITGWFASADQFAFDPLHLVWPDTANRLELGTPSVATAYAGVAGMDMILEVEPERIYPRLQSLTERIVERARADGYGVASPEDADSRGGIVMLRLKHPQDTVAALAQRAFTVDYRPGLLRVSPHFFNTVEDIDRFMDAVAEIQAAIPA